MLTKKKVIDLARSLVGYKGKKNPTDNLYELDAPNGAGKWNRFAADLDALGLYTESGYYNGRKNGYDWCCIFIDWLFWEAAEHDVEKAKAVKPQSGGGCGAGVYWARQAYGADVWKAPTGLDGTLIGTQIFYQDHTGADVHTGLVVDVDYDNDTLWTIEGNWGDKVVMREVSINDSTIKCFGVINYDSEPVPEPVPDEWETLFENESMRIQRRVK